MPTPDIGTEYLITFFMLLYGCCKNFVCFLLFRAAPIAYGSSQARGGIGAIAAGLCHSHSNKRSKPHLQPTPQLTATLDPQPAEQGQGLNPYPHGYQSDSFLLHHHRNYPLSPAPFFLVFAKFLMGIPPHTFINLLAIQASTHKRHHKNSCGDEVGAKSF